jgi:vacuolar-type H+-ATPase subunit F/Vma7
MTEPDRRIGQSVVALGEDHQLDGFALAGAVVIGAQTAAAVREAWDRLGNDVGLVILTTMAAEVLSDELDHRSDRLTVVLASEPVAP